MIQFTEEAQGILALSLYDVNACAAIVASLKKEEAWAKAQVHVGNEADGYQSITKPEARTASVLTSVGGGAVLKEFDNRIDCIVKPLIRTVWGVNLSEHSGTQLIRYKPGGHYVGHTDAGTD